MKSELDRNPSAHAFEEIGRLVPPYWPNESANDEGGGGDSRRTILVAGLKGLIPATITNEAGHQYGRVGSF